MRARLTSIAKWFDGLRYSQKYLLVGLLFALPAVVAVGLLASDSSIRIDRYGYQEKFGTQYLRATRQLMDDVQQHQQLVHDQLIVGTTARAERLAQLQAKIDQDFVDLDQVDQKYGGAFKSTGSVRALQRQWLELKQNWQNLNFDTNLQLHAQIVTDVRTLIALVGDASYLILDPDLDSYYMMDVVLLRLPEAQDLLAQTLMLGRGVVERQTITPDEKAQLLIRSGQIKSNLAAMKTSLQVALDNNPAQNLKPLITTPAQANIDASEQFLTALEERVVNSAAVSMTSAEFVAAGQQALSQSYRLYDAASPALEAVIQNRINQLLLQQIWSIIFATVTLLIASVISTALMRSISRPLNELTRATQQLAAGDLTARVNVSGVSEAAKVSAAFNEMAGRLQSTQQSLTTSTEQLRASSEVGRAAAAILDQDQLLREVVDLIARRFGFYYVAVFMVDSAGQSAVLREASGQAGQALKERGHFLDVNDQSMVGAAITQRRARIALDTGTEAVRFANPLLPDTRSEIALPLTIGNRVLGALDVQSTQAAAFDESYAAILQSMANQIAVALNNAEQFKQIERQSQLQANLAQLSRSLYSATSTEELYQALVTAVSGIVPHDYLSLSLVQSEGAHLREYQLHADAEHLITEGPVRLTRNTLSGQALASRQAAISWDFDSSASPLEDLTQLQHQGFRAAMSLPLLIGERALGTLNFANRDRTAYLVPNTPVLDQVASQVAIALENLQLVQAQQHSLRDLESLTRQLTGQAWANQLQQSPGQVRYKQYARSGVKVDLPTTLPEVELAVETRQPVAWTQTGDDQAQTPYQASLAAPIMLRGEVLGALQVGEVSQPRQWSDDDIAFMQAVADQVALALDNARLLEQTERRAQREQFIAEVSRKMLAASNLQSIIQIAGDELGHALQVGRTEVTVGQTELEPADQSQLQPETSARS